MLTSFLQGGLGNQLFQIAATLAVSVESGHAVVFNTANHDLPKQGRPCEKYIKTIFRNLNFSSEAAVSTDHLYHEPYFHYKKIPPLSGNTCLIGYFQSERYFEKYSSYIRKVFSIDEITKKKINEKYSEVLVKNPIAIHVRRGDYLQFSDTHPPCKMEYYMAAIKEFPDNSNFLVFSDDIAWCKEKFVGREYIFSENNEDLVDFYLISLCSGAIISNSSFSWWASWLGETNNKKIIAPKNWFGESVKFDTRDLLPSRWKII
ncbi:MAG: alpha-1,2-fucosyltransferase [Rhodobacteraceae bacterium]|nr:alpha-1,2-fucosyltransferase [Paracoccaceae bacterium]|tara:strand:+ start:2827 stop:3609 length:783 start_codon:yes stop_codon:yes gene_type:complete